MLHRLRFPVSAVLTLCASAIAAASDPPDMISIDRSSHGFSRVDDRVIGGGPDYRVDLDSDGFSFTAAFGGNASRTWPLELSLVSIGRESGPALEIVPNAPVVSEAHRATWQFGAVSARLESRAEGVEQSFVFATRPAGSGDLVVRQRITTDLATAVATESALRFDAAGLGSVTLGAVTGIDAAGARAAGTLRLEGHSLEYRLPASFVDSAKYPLVLDPLFGTQITVASGFDEHAPDVAFDESTGRYLVVWSRQFSSGDYDIRGQVIDAAGNLILGLIAIDANSTINAVTPRVANMNNSSKSLVTWVESSGFLDGSIQCRTVSVIDGTMSTKHSVGPTTGLNSNPDVGGESQEAFDRAIITWQNYSLAENQSHIMAASVIVPLLGEPTVLAAQTLTSGFDDTQPAVSTHDLLGYHMIVWTRDLVSDTEIRGMVVDKYLNIGDSLITVTNDALANANPAVDGDGYNFLVAYESGPAAGGDHDVEAVRVRAVSSGQWEAAAAKVAVDVGVLNSSEPDVNWFFSSVLVTWKQELLDGSYRAVVMSLDPHGAIGCENYFNLAGTMSNSHALHIGGAHDDLAMVVRSVPQPLTPANTQIVAQRFSAKDGAYKFLSGPCGAMAYANCARVGNSAFALRLTTAPAFAPSYLIVGSSVTNVPCGVCALVVDPTGGLFLPTGLTDATGETSVVTGIPNNPVLAGLKFSAQWLIVKPGAFGACTPLNTAMSNGMEITLQ